MIIIIIFAYRFFFFVYNASYAFIIFTQVGLVSIFDYLFEKNSKIRVEVLKVYNLRVS